MTDVDTNPVHATQSDKPEMDTGRNGRPTIATLLASDVRAQLLEIALVFSPAVMAIAVLEAIAPENPMIWMAGVWFANLMMLGLIWVGVHVRGESFQSIGLNINRPSPIDAFWVLWQSILIAIFAIAAFIVAAVLMVNVVGRPQSADMTQYNYLQGNLSLLLVSLAGVYIVSSFGEEVIYRGFLMTRLERIFGGNTRSAAIFALATSSIIFGLAHYKWGAMGIVQSTCMGFAMGASFLLVKRRLWPLILAHALMDTLLLVPLYLAQAPSS